MQAIRVTGPGGADRLVWADAVDPVPGAGEMLLDVVAAGVNRADLMQREGHYPPPAGASDILGLECSGRVAALGADVTGWQVGDPVCALLDGGGYAERVVVPAGQVMPAPSGIDLSQAAALPEAACTVYSTVVAAGGLDAGAVFLVHGGASGIGTMAIQLGRRRNARVFCTAGTAAKRAHCAQLGAEVTIDYHSEDFVEIVRRHTDSHGADVVLDIMGAEYLGRNVEVLADDGRIVVIAMQGGRRGELDLGRLLARRGTVAAAGLRARPPAQKAAIVGDVVAEVWPAIESGEVRPVVDRIFPMAEAAQAHRHLERGDHVGKVLLVR